MTSPEKLIETAVVALIEAAQGEGSTLPVLRSDQNPATEDFSGVVVTATQSGDDYAVNETDYTRSVGAYSVQIEVRSHATNDGEADTIWGSLQGVLFGPAPESVDLGAFDFLHFLPGPTSDTEVSEGGRKTRTRTFRAAAQIAPEPDPEEPEEPEEEEPEFEMNHPGDGDNP
jgi:hypothetical protein